MKIKPLIKLEFMNFMNINETRHTKDKKHKIRNNTLIGLYFYILIVVVGYMVGLCYLLNKSEAQEYIVPLCYSYSVIVILVLSVFGFGGKFFNISEYEKHIVLPFRKSDILMAKCISMYIKYFVVSFIFMVSGAIFYILNINVNILFFPALLFGIIVTPLFPMAVSFIITFLFSYLFSRIKVNNLVKTIIITVVVFIFMVATISYSPQIDIAFSEGIDKSVFDNIMAIYSKYLVTLIPFMKGIVNTDFIQLFLFALMNIIPFVIIFLLIGWKYAEICSSLINIRTKRNYIVSNEKKSSVLLSLFRKDTGRVFSSMIYVSNGLFGNIASVVICFALLIKPDMLVKYIPQEYITLFIPVILSLFYSLVTITTGLISIEGKNIWLIKSLPVRVADIINSKLLTGMIVPVICHMTNTIILYFAFRFSLVIMLVLFIVPVIFIIFSNVSGLFVNTKLYKLDFRSDTEVIKEGLPLFISMMTNLVICTVFGFLTYFCRSYYLIVTIAFALILSFVSYYLYKKLLKTDFRKID